MFRLLKLLALGLFGYALYEFIRGMMQSEGMGGGMSSGMSGGSSRGAFGGSGSSQGAVGGSSGETSRQTISGPGEGRRVTTSDFDGGSVGHKVGRGVIS